VPFIFWIMTGEYALATIIFTRRFPWAFSEPDANETGRGIWNEYAVFCLPLVVTAWVGFAYSFADRWLLQKYAGSLQQGFLSAAMQFSVITLIGATSLVNIFWRETAHALEQGDQERARRLFLKATRSLYFFAAAIGCFLIPFSRDILQVLLGPAYSGAALAFAVMLFFPVHQNLGQINGAYLQAAGKTRLYLSTNLLGIVLSLPAAYWIVAPRSALVPGLGLGATALAIKMTLVQIVVINVQGWLICRERGWRWPVLVQLLSPAVLSAAAFCCWRLAGLAGPVTGKAGLAFHLGLAGLPFALAVGSLVYAWPSLAGVERAELASWIARGWGALCPTPDADGGKIDTPDAG
jgi:O-antigen/teichoic acid export membrane protein